MADHEHCNHHPAGDETTATDPVCGMKVDTSTAAHRHELDGTTHYFCSARCLERFRAAVRVAPESARRSQRW